MYKLLPLNDNRADKICEINVVKIVSNFLSSVYLVFEVAIKKHQNNSITSAEICVIIVMMIKQLENKYEDELQ